MAASPRRPLVAGNWKMNGLRPRPPSSARSSPAPQALAGKVDLMVCPPATLLASFAEAARGSRVAIGGQDCHAEAAGAFTGDISAEMLADAGASAVIVGHSERRTITRRPTRRCAPRRWRPGAPGLTAIVCIGETRAEREAGRDARRARPPARRLAAGRRDRRQSGGRLRAGLGDRHRADADAGRRRGGARLHPRAARRALRRGRARRCASSMAAR